MARLLNERYALEDKPFRQGGSAALFKGRDVSKDFLPVAVKIFTPARRLEEQILKAIFSSELEVLDRLGRHPNVVEMIDWGLNDGEGHPYVVMEWVDEDLADVLDKTPCEGWDDFAPLALGILHGMAAVHNLNFAHRDIKPENILIASGGVPKVSDFGIAKLITRFNPSLTLAGFGTTPYRPPEADDGNFTLSRDIFAFGVLVIRALSGQQLSTYAEVTERLVAGPNQIDVPPAILDFLIAATSTDPSRRPATAEAALTQLVRIQSERESRRAPKLDVYLSVSAKATESVCARLDIDASDVLDFVLTDTKDTPAISRARDRQTGQDHDGDMYLIGNSFQYRLRPHNQQIGVLAIIGATKMAASQLEMLRSKAWDGHVLTHRAPPLDRQRAAKSIEQLQISLAEHDQARAEHEAQERDRQLFRSWRSILDAKRHIEESRGLPLRYRSCTVEGRRAYFQLTEEADPVVIGDPRLIRIGGGHYLRGEVEDASERALTVFFDRGDLGQIPRSGQLEYDSEAARFAIDRQHDALEAVRHDRAVRPDLASKLLHPETATRPEPRSVDKFFDDRIDDTKRAAICAGLGLQDFLLVEGPPGTGKTTFIAELVAQFLKANPEKRVLLSSQTHIALDNALERIQRLVPSRDLLRIGRPERIATEVEKLRLENQMESWRDDVLKSSRQFLKDYAIELGITVPDADVVELSVELKQVRQKLHDLRSSIQNRQGERKSISAEISELADLGAGVIAIAEQLEATVKLAVPEGLRDAAQAFIEKGVDLAAKLEAGGKLGDRLLELEQSLVDSRQQVGIWSESEERLRHRVAEALGLSTGPESLPTTEQLLERLAKADAANHPKLAKLQEIYKEWEARFGKGSQFNGALLERAKVVAATCVGLAGIRGALDVTFDLCILDEASKATATEALVPMSRSLKWIVVGDRNQLPPFQEDALTDPTLLQRFDLSPGDLEQTLFDHLADSLPAECKYSLNKQYRMVPYLLNN